GIIIIVCFILLILKHHQYNVVAIGLDNATNLGINVNKLVKESFMIIIILVAATTTLIGPLTFLGFMASQLCYVIFKTYRHYILLINGFLIASLLVITSLILIELILNYTLLIGPIINLIGGIYFIKTITAKEKIR
ncbi:MAG: iron chelate uptake ABC transporter family permease subunit, partial [Bacilli bacterium]